MGRLSVCRALLWLWCGFSAAFTPVRRGPGGRLRAACGASSQKDAESYRVLWNRLEYARHRDTQSRKRYQIISAEIWEDMALNLEATYPERFHFHKTSWGKFPDGTDNIEVGGFTPHNVIAGERVLFLASFHNNDVTLSQFQVMVMLLQSFIDELVVVLPYYPVGTMERTVKEGQVATANTYAQMFSNLPSCGRPTRLIIYDLHTLQNRFYMHGSVIASLKTTVPRLLPLLDGYGIDCIAFPDDGAAKRFAHMFAHLDLEIVTCGKVRDGEKRIVTIQDGNPEGRTIVIVDDLVQTGGTLYECGVALRDQGAKEVFAFVAHGVFPQAAWTRFAADGDRCVFKKFFLTNSIPTTTNSLPEETFEVLDLTPQVVHDLDNY
uniref:Phosphoribosyltransferase domain-containing protein n=1 Tax=Rhizochromulina marina TaxID=1034831 RepID=A0A7S2R758_9STRA